MTFWIGIDYQFHEKLVIGNQYQLPIFFRIGNWYFRNSRKNGQIMSSLDYWKTWLHFEYQNLILHHKIAIHSNHKLFLSFFCPRIAHFRENDSGASYAARACLVVFASKRTEWNCAGIAQEFWNRCYRGRAEGRQESRVSYREDQLSNRVNVLARPLD